MIRYLKHQEIDKVRWDECLVRAKHGLVYAKSWFLDIVSPGWEGLVENDYESVMPLPVKWKLFVPYLVQPLFTQQLGVFSTNPLTPEKVNDYLERIPRKFFRQIFNLNSSNILPFKDSVNNRQNFELDLNREYKLICNQYNENTKRNIRKSGNAGLLIEFSHDTGLFVSLYKKLAKFQIGKYGDKVLRKLVEHCIKNHSGHLIFVKHPGGKIIAGAFFLEDLGRIIYMGSFNSVEGEETSAMFLVIDEMIRRNSDKPLIFDFEGSMIPGVARFFTGFGAEKKMYQSYRKGF